MASPILHASLSDPGRRHAVNEDRWLADPDHGLYVVADGMADERPAQLAVNRLPERLLPRVAGIDDAGDPRAEEAVRSALAEVSEEVRDLEIMGSTVVLALVRGRRALFAHLGDSRIYLFRQAGLRPLTRDHSRLQEMVDRGELTPEEAAAGKYDCGPTRFLGMWGEPEADVSVLDLQPGDRLLLCSDGLTAMLSDDELGQILAGQAGPAEACRRLIDAANAAGGADNITALVLAVPASA